MVVALDVGFRFTEVQGLKYVTPPLRQNTVVTPGLLQELIESMPERIEAVIKADGKFTKY